LTARQGRLYGSENLAKLYLDNVTKVFDKKVEAVKNVSWEVPDKSLVSLLGPSGCGKTTTMRIIAGLEAPTSGRVYMDDADVTDLRPRERDVGMLFQFAVVYPEMSVYENLAFPLKARGISAEDIKRRVNEVAEALGLASIIDRIPTKMDMSVQQRVALGRAIVRPRKLYLLDEPLTNIDPKARIELRSLLKEIQAELNQTIIYVTHDQTEAMTLSDKIAVMSEGRILQYATPETIYDSPAHTFVAHFIGDPGTNLIDCSLEKHGSKALLNAGIFKVDASGVVDLIERTSTSSELVLGIRPEAVQLSKTREGPDWLAGRCSLVETVGNVIILHLMVGEQLIKVMAPVLEVLAGDEVYLRLPRRFMRVFDRKTGKVIAPLGSVSREG
jgi:ABC-type sugar transport system ATPase subunit